MCVSFNKLTRFSFSVSQISIYINSLSVLQLLRLFFFCWQSKLLSTSSIRVCFKYFFLANLLHMFACMVSVVFSEERDRTNDSIFGRKRKNFALQFNLINLFTKTDPIEQSSYDYSNVWLELYPESNLLPQRFFI